MDQDIIAALMQFQAQQAQAENNRLADASPELLDALAAYGVLPERQQVNALDYKNALGFQNAEMPDLMRTRNATVAASPISYLASALRQGIGGQERQKSMAAMNALLDKKQGFNRQFGQAEQDFARSQIPVAGAMQPPPAPPPPMDPMEAWLAKGRLF